MEKVHTCDWKLGGGDVATDTKHRQTYISHRTAYINNFNSYLLLVDFWPVSFVYSWKVQHDDFWRTPLARIKYKIHGWKRRFWSVSYASKADNARVRTCHFFCTPGIILEHFFVIVKNKIIPSQRDLIKDLLLPLLYRLIHYIVYVYTPEYVFFGKHDFFGYDTLHHQVHLVWTLFLSLVVITQVLLHNRPGLHWNCVK